MKVIVKGLDLDISSDFIPPEISSTILPPWLRTIGLPRWLSYCVICESTNFDETKFYKFFNKLGNTKTVIKLIKDGITTRIKNCEIYDKIMIPDSNKFGLILSYRSYDIEVLDGK